MSFGPCEVVKIKSEAAPGGYVVINKTDFSAEAGHELFEGASAPDFVQEPHVTAAVAAQHSGEASQAVVAGAVSDGWAAHAQPPPVEPQEAPAAAKAKK